MDPSESFHLRIHPSSGQTVEAADINVLSLVNFRKYTVFVAQSAKTGSGGNGKVGGREEILLICR